MKKEMVKETVKEMVKETAKRNAQIVHEQIKKTFDYHLNGNEKSALVKQINFNVQKYIAKDSLAFEKSCAKQITDLITNKPSSLNELIQFAQTFYDKLESDLAIEKRCVWMTNRKNESTKDNAQSTWNKHVSYLWKVQGIPVCFDKGKYYINACESLFDK